MRDWYEMKQIEEGRSTFGILECGRELRHSSDSVRLCASELDKGLFQVSEGGRSIHDNNILYIDFDIVYPFISTVTSRTAEGQLLEGLFVRYRLVQRYIEGLKGPGSYTALGE
jgi:hypothetical protein